MLLSRGGFKMLLQKIDCSGVILKIKKNHFLKIALNQGGVGDLRWGLVGGELRRNRTVWKSKLTLLRFVVPLPLVSPFSNGVICVAYAWKSNLLTPSLRSPSTM